MAGSARDWKRRVMNGKLAARGVRLEDLEAGPVKNPLAAEIFQPRGKVNLMTELPPELPAAAGLYLMSLSTDKSQSSQWPRTPTGPAVVTVHPEAAAGVADGGMARLVSAIGALDVRVKHDRRQRRDVALMAKGGHLSAGRCPNVLIRARTTDAGEGGALYDERVWLEPLTGSPSPAP
jgi:anaerobic selenocysteine-containing dehydrogenase